MKFTKKLIKMLVEAIPHELIQIRKQNRETETINKMFDAIEKNIELKDDLAKQIFKISRKVCLAEASENPQRMKKILNEIKQILNSYEN